MLLVLRMGILIPIHFLADLSGSLCGGCLGSGGMQWCIEAVYWLLARAGFLLAPEKTKIMNKTFTFLGHNLTPLASSLMHYVVIVFFQ